MVKVILIYIQEVLGNEYNSDYSKIIDYLEPVDLTKEEINLIHYNKEDFKHPIYGYPVVIALPDKEEIKELKLNIKERIEEVKKKEAKGIEARKKREATIEKNRLERKKKQLEKLKKELETTSE